MDQGHFCCWFNPRMTKEAQVGGSAWLVGRRLVPNLAKAAWGSLAWGQMQSWRVGRAPLPPAAGHVPPHKPTCLPLFLLQRFPGAPRLSPKHLEVRQGSRMLHATMLSSCTLCAASRQPHITPHLPLPRL